MKILHFLSCAAVVMLPLSNAQLCSNEERNRDFSNGTYSWIEKGNYTSEMMKEVDGNSTNLVLAVKNRKHHFAGPSQDLDKGCYNTGDMVEVEVKLKLYTQQDDVTEMYGYSCDIQRHWGEDEGNDGIDTHVCPALTLRLMKNGKPKHIDIAAMVPPYVNGAYNTLHGTFFVTQEMMDADSMNIYFSKAEAKVNMYIEHVFVDVIDRCEGAAPLIQNGDGENGDAKGWSQHGTRTGLTDVVQHDLSVGAHSIWSRYRANWNDGVKVDVDAGCLEAGALYELRALVHLTHQGKGVGCDYTLTDVRVAGERCPLASVGAYNEGGPLQQRSVASPTGPWVQEEFNVIKGSFSFFANELRAERLVLFFNTAPANVDMILDEVTLTKIRNATSLA